jgi:TrmH family RNA methyltransferase
MERDSKQIRFVLVRPEGPLNIGASARAMKNFGMTHLTLVSPPPLSGEAQMMAYGAEDLLESAQIVETLDDAIRDVHLVIGTTRRHGKMREPLYTLKDKVEEVRTRSQQEEIAILFGPERTGLEEGDLQKCHFLLEIPTNPQTPSINLAQAVLLVAYELFEPGPRPHRPYPPFDDSWASMEDQERFFRHLEKTLHEIGYFHPGNPAMIMNTFRALFGRSGLLQREVSMLRGMLRRINKLLVANLGKETSEPRELIQQDQKSNQD